MKFRLALLLLAFVAVCLLPIIAYAYLGDTAQVIAALFGSFFLLFGLPKITRRLRNNSRMKSKGADEILSSDSRPPIVLLRSFVDDGTSPEAIIADMTKLVGSYLSFEESIASHFESMGPFVTFSSKKYGMPELGAARLHAEPHEWKSKLEELLLQCKLVVFRAGETKSLQWELGRLVQIVPPEKVLIYLQMGSEVDRDVQEARYNKFRKFASQILPRELPTKRGKSSVMYFKDGWEPVLSSNMKSALKEKGLVFEEYSLRHNLKQVMPSASTYKYKRLQNEYYDQKFNYPIHTLIFFLFGCVLASLLGYIYGLIGIYNNAWAFNFIPLIMLPILLGAFLGILGKFLAFKDGWLYLSLGILCGMIFMHVKWMQNLYVIYHEIIISPDQIMNKVGEIIAFVTRPVSTGTIFDIVNYRDTSAEESSLWMFYTLEYISAVVLTSIFAWVYGLSESEYYYLTEKRHKSIS